jgi:hypothetical protein
MAVVTGVCSQALNKVAWQGCIMRAIIQSLHRDLSSSRPRIGLRFTPPEKRAGRIGQYDSEAKNELN